jgi:hypothetical protein
MKLLHLMGSLLLCGAALSYPAPAQQKNKPADKPAAAEEQQAPKSIAESVSRNLAYAEGDFLSIAKAMPDDKYTFIPTAGKFEGVRSFAEQVKHVAWRSSPFSTNSKAKSRPTTAKKAAMIPHVARRS